jgi:hypothetical protein
MFAYVPARLSCGLRLRDLLDAVIRYPLTPNPDITMRRTAAQFNPRFSMSTKLI